MLRFVLVSSLVIAFGAACSTPISPYSPFDDADEETALDGGLGTARDAGPTRDSSTAGTGGTAGSSDDCTRVPLNGVYGSLFNDGCATRQPESCSTRSGQVIQQVVNQWLTDIATKCGARANAAIGVVFDRSGCPQFYGYSDQSLRGRVAGCIEDQLNNRRLGCTPRCALMGSISR